MGSDVKLTSRDFTDNSTTGATREVSLYFDSGDVVIGGDLLLQSGDSLLADTGSASISTGDSLLDLVQNGWSPSDYNTGSLIVGGALPTPLPASLLASLFGSRFRFIDNELLAGPKH